MEHGTHRQAGSDVFTIDFDYDRWHASDGRSRFNSYVTRFHDRLRDAAEDGAIEWALQVWHVATAPTMFPGFIRPADGAGVVDCRWSEGLDGPYCTVDFASDFYAVSAAARFGSWRFDHRNNVELPVAPGLGRPNILTIVRVQVVLDWEGATVALPKRDAPLYPAAVDTCRWLVDRLNALIIDARLRCGSWGRGLE